MQAAGGLPAAWHKISKHVAAILEIVTAWHKISKHVDAILQIVKKFESTPNQGVSFNSLIKSGPRHKLGPEPGSGKQLESRFVNIRS